MPRRATEPPVEEQPKKRIASNGNRLPDPIREGEILTDITQNQWKLGKSVGLGGFGEIYLASKVPCKTVGPDAQYVIKVEPHKNGPLFVEINFYISVAKAEMIEEWKKSKRLKHLGISPYIGSGSHVYGGEKYRFLVLKRFGQDLDKLFLKNGQQRLPLKTVCYLAIQILDVLEYIHEHNFVHGDIKGANLLVGYSKGTENNVYLLDYGLACKYRRPDGTHKQYHVDQRKAHDGTLEYTSRDAHIGAHSRRGDLEILGYNILQWLCGTLPWKDSLADPEYVHLQKNSFMANIPLLMRRCFPNSQAPALLSQYLKYVVSLGFDTKPDYTYCRNLFLQGLLDAGYVDDRKLVFENTPPPKVKTKKRGDKRKAVEEPENIVEMKPKKIIRTAWRQPCVAHNFNRMTRNSPTSPVLRSHHQFSWEKIISGNPEKVNRKTGIPAKLENGTAVHRPLKRVRPQVPKTIPEEQEPEGQSKTTGTVDYGIPTPAMLEIMNKQRSSAAPTGGRKSRCESSRCNSPVESPYPYTITPAMAKVIQRREELRQLEETQSYASSDITDDISDNHSYVVSCSAYSSDEEDNQKLFRTLRRRVQKTPWRNSVQPLKRGTRANVKKVASVTAARRRTRSCSIATTQPQAKKNPGRVGLTSKCGRRLRSNTLRG